MPVKVISSGTARADRARVGVVVTGGPTGMVPLMSGTLIVMARALTARTVRARPLVVMAA
ncbi:hypothetical protein [Microtetraspora malaysiensis]|uniref:hypothetical protein n=1 Tax=Microtetraspora malaysiensis TaxID=161358 RepID=UPI003D93D9F3